MVGLNFIDCVFSISKSENVILDARHCSALFTFSAKVHRSDHLALIYQFMSFIKSKVLPPTIKSKNEIKITFSKALYPPIRQFHRINTF